MVNVAIIGGGPAGLAAAHALSRHGVDFTLFEAGDALADRRHDAADQLGAGIGGAGLFSDGKFSFFPSGTHLYKLRDRSRLEAAYTAIESQLTKAGIEAPPMSDWGDGAVVAGSENMVSKPYLSTYGSLEQRNALIADMTSGFRDRIRTNASVEVIEAGATGYHVRWRDREGQAAEDEFSHIIMATGRFGPQALPAMLVGGADMTEMRYEFGIRIEHPNSIGFLNAIKRPDVKYILDALSTEVRTFCTCRDGEVWMIPYGGVAALSGRSDGPKSGYSNFGLLARFTGEGCEKGRRIWPQLQTLLGDENPATWQRLTDFLRGPGHADDGGPVEASSRPWFPRGQFRKGDVAGLLPGELWEILAKSAGMLIERFPDMASPETICIFPAIEGVGAFPESDADMKGSSGNIWYCGDVVGRFRGLVPALVSGEYAGATLVASLAESEEGAELQTEAAQ